MEFETGMKEFIICSAIDYNGLIICGRRHENCYETLESLKPNIPSNELPDRDKQGFMTSLGRYVGRREAFKIAKENNQIWHKLHEETKDNILASEDLY